MQILNLIFLSVVLGQGQPANDQHFQCIEKCDLTKEIYQNPNAIQACHTDCWTQFRPAGTPSPSSMTQIPSETSAGKDADNKSQGQQNNSATPSSNGQANPQQTSSQADSNAQNKSAGNTSSASDSSKNGISKKSDDKDSDKKDGSDSEENQSSNALALGTSTVGLTVAFLTSLL